MPPAEPRSVRWEIGPAGRFSTVIETLPADPRYIPHGRQFKRGGALILDLSFWFQAPGSNTCSSCPPPPRRCCCSQRVQLMATQTAQTKPELCRQVFTTSRELEYFTETELVTQTGYDKEEWWPGSW